MNLNPFELLEKAINEHGSSTILKERLELFKEKHKHLEDEVESLKQTNEELVKEIDRLRNEIAQKSTPDSFVKARGVLFHKLENGKIEEDAYCPNCKRPMSSLGGHIPYNCRQCKFTAGFTGQEIKSVIASISN